jgi:1-acyl-sn-glycerol-3-phosphate acyltransferase
LVAWLAFRLLTALDWDFRGRIPPLPKLVVAGAPHTSNWDFVVFLAALHAYGIRVRFMAKHTLFRWPFGYLFRALGGIPVDRNRPGGVTEQVSRIFDASTELILVIAPEGTRRAAPFWRSGFLSIAAATGSPIVFASVDYPRRQVSLSPAIPYDGDATALMDVARGFYEGKRGLRRHGRGPVRLEEEA